MGRVAQGSPEQAGEGSRQARLAGLRGRQDVSRCRRAARPDLAGSLRDRVGTRPAPAAGRPVPGQMARGMQAMGGIHRLAEVVSKFLMVVAAMWSFVLAFYILIDVIARNLNVPIEGTSEIVTNSIVVVVFLQLAYCVHAKGMLRADFLLAMMGPRLQRGLDIAGYLLAGAFFAALVYGSFPGALEAWVENEFEGDGALRVPTWPAHFARSEEHTSELQSLMRISYAVFCL